MQSHDRRLLTQYERARAPLQCLRYCRKKEVSYRRAFPATRKTSTGARRKCCGLPAPEGTLPRILKGSSETPYTSNNSRRASRDVLVCNGRIPLLIRAGVSRFLDTSLLSLIPLHRRIEYAQPPLKAQERPD